MLAITVDLQRGVPPYEQVRDQIAGHIRAGSLKAGDRLPVVRVLAADLGIAPNTIARAYRELATEGLVLPRRRVGTIVQEPNNKIGEAVRARLAGIIDEVRSEGASDQDILDVVRGCLSFTQDDPGLSSRARN